MGPEAAALLALVLAAPPANPGGAWARWHFVFGKEMEMSILFRRDASGDDTRLLVRCEAGRFALVSRQDPTGDDSTESVTETESGETLERRILLRGREGVAGCEDVPPPDACLLWTSGGGRVASRMSQFSGERAPAARRRVAALVSEGFRGRLEALAPYLAWTAELRVYTDDFLGLVWPEWFRRPGTLRKGTRTRGCDFDAGFRYPCSEEELAREESRFGPGSVNGPGGAPPTRTPPRPPRG